jgi:hypothetical protein
MPVAISMETHTIGRTAAAPLLATPDRTQFVSLLAVKLIPTVGRRAGASVHLAYVSDAPPWFHLVHTPGGGSDSGAASGPGGGPTRTLGRPSGGPSPANKGASVNEKTYSPSSVKYI